MYIMCVYRTVRIVLFYNGGFVTPNLTGVREYVGRDTMKRIKVDVEKLSVSYIRNMFDFVVGESDKLYYLCNGVSPRGGYKLLVSDDQIPEIVHVATKAYGAGVIRLHLYHVNGDGEDYELCENEAGEDIGDEVGGFEGADEVGGFEGAEVGGFEGAEIGGFEGGEGVDDEDSDDEDYVEESEKSESEDEIGDGSGSDLDDCRRIREEVRHEQQQLERVGRPENEASEGDTDSEYCRSADSGEETDGDVAYAEPRVRKRKLRVKEVFNMETDGKDIKWVPGLTFGDKAQVKDAVRSFSIASGRPLKYSVDDQQRIQVVPELVHVEYGS